MDIVKCVRGSPRGVHEWSVNLCQGKSQGSSGVVSEPVSGEFPGEFRSGQ